MGKKKKKKKNKKSLLNKLPKIDIGDVDVTSKESPDIDDNIEGSKTKKDSVSIKAREGLGEELIEVYESSGDELSSVTTFEHKRRTWKRALVWILVFLVTVFIGVAAVSWYMWGRSPKFTGENVVFELEAAEMLSSGSPISYSVRYGNNESISFRKAEIELRYPPGFIFEKADPEPTTGDDLFNLSALAVGEQGVITVEGFLVGKPDAPSTISGVFRYWPSNFSSEFQEVASAQTEIESLDLEVKMDGPDQILVGQKTTYSIVYGNETEEPIKNIAFEVVYPDSFVVEETNPALDKQSNIWEFEELSPDEEKEISIDGYYSAAADDAVDFRVMLRQKGAEDYFDQQEYSVTTTVVEGDLAVNLIVNGLTKDGTVQWGDILSSSITYNNNSEADLFDLEVIAVLESRYISNSTGSTSQGALDWQSLVDSNNGSLKELDSTDDHTLRKRSITWTSDDMPELEHLKSKEDAAINFQIGLRDLTKAAELIEFPEDAGITMSVSVKVGKTGGVEEETIVSGNQINFMISSDLVLSSESRYYGESGEQVGSGALPPEVGEKTSYRLYWQLDNSLHEVSDVIVSTELPSNVSWLNDYQVSAGEVDHSSGNNSISWRLNRIPTDVSSVVLFFDVELNPLASQVDDVANLTKKITLTATDSFTGGKIIQTLLPLTTGVPNDDRASDKGIVIN